MISTSPSTSFDNCSTLLAAYRNPYHAAPLLRAGVKMELKDGFFSLKTCKAVADAKRPPRGMPKGVSAGVNM